MTTNIADQDQTERLLKQIHEAMARRTPLRIRGGDSKRHLGRPVDADELDTRDHTGVVRYDPTELVITVRAGTRLQDLNNLLRANDQHLPPEAPDYSGVATVGGMVAAAVAGPRRPWAGSVRDFVLGCRVISAQGKHLRFGGDVMKNVAGYDFSRLLAGSHGCLGVITEVSLKVLPLPRASQSLCLDVDADSALRLLAQWKRENLPISGACHWDNRLHIRLEGGRASVEAACARLNATPISDQVWEDLREHRLPFFQTPRTLWRLSVPATTALADFPGDVLLDWGGAQRWVKSDAPAREIRRIAAALRGHATCYTPGVDDNPFEPLPPEILRLHQRLKAQLDPARLFNPGRMYAEI